MTPFKVIIAGCRDFNDYGLLCRKCDTILANKRQSREIVIVSGTARGADQLGERYARERGYKVQQYPADWDHGGKAAGPIRNAKMAANADALIAFWDGESRGTKNMIDTAGRRGLDVRIIQTKDINNRIAMDARTDQKWAEILQFAREHATGEGMHKGYRWLQDAFEEYFNDHEERVEKGTMWSFGGASFSDHNRTVFAAQIARALRYNEHGYEGPRLTDEQFEKLTDTLQWIKEHPLNEQIKL